MKIELLQAGVLAGELDLSQGEYTVGRGEECIIVVDDPSLAQVHAKIYADEGAAYVEPVQGETQVNGASILARTVLTDSDQLSFGSIKLSISIPSIPPPLSEAVTEDAIPAVANGYDAGVMAKLKAAAKAFLPKRDALATSVRSLKSSGCSSDQTPSLTRRPKPVVTAVAYLLMVAAPLLWVRFMERLLDWCFVDVGLGIASILVVPLLMAAGLVGIVHCSFAITGTSRGFSSKRWMIVTWSISGSILAVGILAGEYYRTPLSLTLPWLAMFAGGVASHAMIDWQTQQQLRVPLWLTFFPPVSFPLMLHRALSPTIGNVSIKGATPSRQAYLRKSAFAMIGLVAATTICVVIYRSSGHGERRAGGITSKAEHPGRPTQHQDLYVEGTDIQAPHATGVRQSEEADSIWLPLSEDLAKSSSYTEGYTAGVYLGRRHGLDIATLDKGIKKAGVYREPSNREEARRIEWYNSGYKDGFEGRKPRHVPPEEVVSSIDACIMRMNRAARKLKDSSVPRDLTFLTYHMNKLLNEDHSLQQHLTEDSAPDDAEFVNHMNKCRRLSERRKSLVNQVYVVLRSRLSGLRIPCVARLRIGAIPIDEHSSTAPRYRDYSRSDYSVPIVEVDRSLVLETPLVYKTWQQRARKLYGCYTPDELLVLEFRDADALPTGTLPLDPLIRLSRDKYANLGVNEWKAPSTESSVNRESFAKKLERTQAKSRQQERESQWRFEEKLEHVVNVSLTDRTDGSIGVAGIAKDEAVKIKAGQPKMSYSAELTPMVVILVGFKDHFPTDRIMKEEREYAMKQTVILKIMFCFGLTEQVTIGKRKLSFPKK